MVGRLPWILLTGRPPDSHRRTTTACQYDVAPTISIVNDLTVNYDLEDLQRFVASRCDIGRIHERQLRSILMFRVTCPGRAYARYLLERVLNTMRGVFMRRVMYSARRMSVVLPSAGAIFRVSWRGMLQQFAELCPSGVLSLHPTNILITNEFLSDHSQSSGAYKRLPSHGSENLSTWLQVVCRTGLRVWLRRLKGMLRSNISTGLAERLRGVQFDLTSLLGRRRDAPTE